jgi:hypothetical protein
MIEDPVTLKVEITLSKRTLEEFWSLVRSIAKPVLQLDLEAVDIIRIDQEAILSKFPSAWDNLLAELGTCHAIDQNNKILNELGL